MVATVAALAPEIAPKIAEVPTAVTPRLPRTEPNAFVSLPQAAAGNPGCQQYRTKVDFYDSPEVATKNAVKDALVREGVPAQAITVIGRGESQLLVPTADGVREPQNRRVEIVIQ